MIYRINPVLGMRQVVWIGMGILIFFGSYYIVKNIDKWREWANLYFILSIILFLATLLFGTNKKKDPLIGLQLEDLVFSLRK